MKSLIAFLILFLSLFVFDNSFAAGPKPLPGAYGYTSGSLGYLIRFDFSGTDLIVESAKNPFTGLGPVANGAQKYKFMPGEGVYRAHYNDPDPRYDLSCTIKVVSNDQFRQDCSWTNSGARPFTNVFIRYYPELFSVLK